MRKRSILPLLILLAVFIGGAAALYVYVNRGSPVIQYEPNRPSSPTSQSSNSLVDHVVVIAEENKPEATIIGSPNAPFINNLARTYAYAKNYHAVTNPSLPNYIALTSGTTAGITNDCNPPRSSCQANVRNIADEIEAAGKTWREYAESMPAPCTRTNSEQYAVKHNPFMYYPDITSNAAHCNVHVVPYTQFSKDLSSSAMLPNFSFITPNLCNDMHDCSIRIGDNWLSQEVPKILSSPAFTKGRALLVIVWDEGNSSNNAVPAIFAGPAARKGYASNAAYNHYSLLHTIEQLWNLQPLTSNDKTAPVMTDILQ